MEVYAVRHPAKYIVLNLPQVYMLGRWNRLHLLVRSVVSPIMLKIYRGYSKPLDENDLDIKQANLILH
jgi:hypothetical protein